MYLKPASRIARSARTGPVIKTAAAASTSRIRQPPAEGGLVKPLSTPASSQKAKPASARRSGCPPSQVKTKTTIPVARKRLNGDCGAEGNHEKRGEHHQKCDQANEALFGQHLQEVVVRILVHDPVGTLRTAEFGRLGPKPSDPHAQNGRRPPHVKGHARHELARTDRCRGRNISWGGIRCADPKTDGDRAHECPDGKQSPPSATLDSFKDRETENAQA